MGTYMSTTHQVDRLCGQSVHGLLDNWLFFIQVKERLSDDVFVASFCADGG